MKGLVFFDLDGTLLNGASQLDPAVAEAIHQLSANGYEPFLATGRSPIEVSAIMEAAGITSGVFMNGQAALFHGELLYERTLAPATIQRLYDLVEHNGDGLSLYNTQRYNLVIDGATEDAAYQYIHSNTPPIDATFHLKEPVVMALLLAEPGHDDDYREAFPELHFLRNTPYSVDIIAANQSKAVGIQAIREALQATDLPTYAFGDGPNDFEMFDVVDTAIAMGNAIDALKERADYVTTANTENGIINGLHHFQLL